MSTANNERGLSLRSPGRFLATTDRLLELWSGAESELDVSATVARWLTAWSTPGSAPAPTS